MPEPVKRQYCDTCLRPQSACICRWVRPLAHQAEVLILQHPQEAGQAKNSARLLHLSLVHSQLVVAEQFESAQLQALLFAPSGTHSCQPLLLYPPDPPGADLPAPPPLAASALEKPEQLRLVVLDATWRKSRKMLYLNPLLQRLPRLSLKDAPASRYRIRKAHKEGQLSTLEATCYALEQLEQAPLRYQSLLAAFDGFVGQQAAYAKRDADRGMGCAHPTALQAYTSCHLYRLVP